MRALLHSASTWLYLSLAGCSSEPAGGASSAQPPVSQDQVALPPPSSAPSSAELVALGRTLVDKHQCSRCHAGTGTEPVATDKHCYQCHVEIFDKRFKAPPEVLSEWRPRVEHLRFTPSLSSVGRLVRPEWVESYLLAPHDLRPRLVGEMPRLSLDEDGARAIAAYLGSLPADPLPAPSTLVGDRARGRKLFADKGCSGCHAFTGAGTDPPPNLSEPASAKDRALAPDLAHARQRLIRANVVAYILEPSSVKPGAAMPKFALSEQDAADLAELIFTTPLDAPAKRSVPSRLPLLTRHVGYDEVAEKLLHKICWHCHSQPDYARGDGGPGNTGGFGFAPRKLDLSSYESIASGYLDDKGERRSLFTNGPSGEPILLEVLLARQKEHAGQRARVRGMPLGLPPVSPELIQLIETWIAAGHPR